MIRFLLIVSLSVTFLGTVFAQGKTPTQHAVSTSPQARPAVKRSRPSANRPRPPANRSPQARSATTQAGARTAQVRESVGKVPPLYTIDTPASPTPPDASVLGNVLKNQLLRVCVRADIPPFGHFSNNSLVGFDIQLAREIAMQLSIYYKKNLRIAWSVIDAGARIDSLIQNNCDMVVAAFSKTKARARLVSFSRVYLQTHKVIMKKVTISRKNPVIALVRGTTTSGQKLSGAVRFFRNYTEIIDAMERAEIDYAVTDQPIAVHMLRSVPQPYTILRILTQRERYAVGVNQNSKALLQAINKALYDLARSGRLAYLQRQWL